MPLPLPAFNCSRARCRDTTGSASSTTPPSRGWRTGRRTSWAGTSEWLRSGTGLAHRDPLKPTALPTSLPGIPLPPPLPSRRYVFLAASSSFKGKSDLTKYEKARKLKTKIDDIRKHYERLLQSSDAFDRQSGTAMWIIDRLALRVGGEKDEDEADTVGCCSLRVEHLAFPEDGQSITLDFLGKDSMRYFQTINVSRARHRAMPRASVYPSRSAIVRMKAPGALPVADPPTPILTPSPSRVPPIPHRTLSLPLPPSPSQLEAYGAIGKQVLANLRGFCKGRRADEDVFSELTPTRLNEQLSALMPGLSAKVFRTYNASVTLEAELELLPLDTKESEKVRELIGGWHCGQPPPGSGAAVVPRSSLSSLR